ncbi:uncharacterized protein LOC108462788 [Gossypium arboreum]|uniref:uncharacterized protein LOC108462788 n=1 Tax=Gossypium arboreum TaxID=29729 RepID=UPI0022F1687A|nr:uncharacterized protein LOC108462788 [Gossypium arboreum]
MIFINTLKAPFINHMLGGATKSFTDIVMSGKMIENAIMSGKIEAGESARRSAPKKRENKVDNVSMGHVKPITVNQPRSTVTGQQASTGHEPNTRQKTEKLQFTPIPITYRELVVEKLINVVVVKFDDTPGTENPLPNHTVNAVNVIVENMGRRVKLDIVEVKTPMREVLKKMVERGLIIQDFESKSREAGNYCEFHGEKDHEIETCDEFRVLVQGLMNNKELEFLEFVDEKDVFASEDGLIKWVGEVNHPVVIISRPEITGAGTRTTPKVVIQKPAAFSYKDDKRAHWSYNCNVKSSEEGRLVSTLDMKVEPVKERTKSLVNEPITADEAKEFLKFLIHSEYSVVEQLYKQPARTSILTLLQNSEAHRNALMKVLNETYVAEDISVNKLDCLVSNISVENFISFSDNEILPGGMGSINALHITTRYKGYTLPGVLIDNGSALNVLPLSILNRLPIDNSHMKTCQNIVRAFDGTKRKVMGRIEVPLQIRPNTYEVDFLVMDIRPFYNCLLGTPWIHSAGAVPSSLYQKLKLVAEGRLIIVNTEKDIIASIASNAPYIKNKDEVIECSFWSLEFINTTFIIEGDKIPTPELSEATRMSLQLMVGKGASLGRGLRKYLHRRVKVPVFVEKWDRFGLGHKPDTKQKKEELVRKQEKRRAPLSGAEVKWESMNFPHISNTFVLGGIIHLE